ncbi:hypothetical protein AVEN_186668-1, partial [Araneus ventricosus]
KILNDPNECVKSFKVIEIGSEVRGSKEKKKEHYRVFSAQAHRTKKKRMVLWMMLIKTMILKSICCRCNNDGEGDVEFEGLVDSCQVVQNVETKGSAARKVR